MKKRIVIIVILAAAAAAWMWSSGRFGKKSDRIQISGNLELTQVDLAFKLSGRLVELNVREGDWVKKGQVIARVDATQLERQKARDQAAVGGAQSAYQQLITSIEYQKATLEGDIAARHAEVNEAQAKLDALLNGSRPQDIQTPGRRRCRREAQNRITRKRIRNVPRRSLRTKTFRAAIRSVPDDFGPARRCSNKRKKGCRW